MRKTNLWCFLLLLALAAVPCAANVFVASATFDVNVNDIYVPFIACGNLNFTDCGAADADPGGHGEPAGTYTSLLSTNAQSGYISVFGLDATTGDVIVGFNNGVSAVGNPWPFLTPEATIASDIAGGATADNAALATFFADNLSFWVAPSLNNFSIGQLVEFSNGVSVGTIEATTITPEPDSIWVTMLMLVGASLVRFLAAKRRQAR